MKKLLNLALGLLITVISVAQEKKAVSADAFEKGITDPKAIIVDVRRPEEFKEGHIKGAVNANWQNPEEFKEKTAKLDKSQPIYLYCLGGVRSDKAADYLIQSGFKQVIGLDGGIKAWNEAGKPVAKP
jgi:rhodanese-related sulfurtransferase